MARTRYFSELRALQDEAFAVGDIVADAMVRSVAQLTKRDVEASRLLIANDRLINERCHDLEMAALTTIATEAPVATDVRLLAAVLDTANELERVGDYAKGIASINVNWPGEALPAAVCVQFTQMADLAQGMLRGALSAFLSLDRAAAEAVLARDDEVDSLFNVVFAEVLRLYDGQAGSGNGFGRSSAEQSNYLVWIAHNLERGADRATNICQRVIFTVTGDVKDLDKH